MHEEQGLFCISAKPWKLAKFAEPKKTSTGPKLNWPSSKKKRRGRLVWPHPWASARELKGRPLGRSRGGPGAVWLQSTRNKRVSARFRSAALTACALLLLDAGAGEAGDGAKTGEAPARQVRQGRESPGRRLWLGTGLDGRGGSAQQGHNSRTVTLAGRETGDELDEAANGATPAGDACNEEEGARAPASMNEAWQNLVHG